ncbi:MAG: sugar phosphate isomerase/epimerase [Ruminococcaceae bacterium]|nr:sugar phosphate isomerase/epimerase [Oscillospiraceae bacterium]
MAIGASSACFYPMETKESLEEIGKLDIHTAEIFFNADSELSGEYLKELNGVKSCYGIETPSLHPFTSACESFFFFSRYKKRFYEMCEYYKKFFNAANEIGAKYLVIHGARFPCEVSDEEYFERFGYLVEEGKKFSVDVVQENVWSMCAGNPDFLRKMKAYLGENFMFNFDVKQMKKCGFELHDFLPEFSSSVVNVHVSDNKTGETCLPPGTGEFSFEKLFEEMKKVNYSGNYIVELYRHNFSSAEDVKKSCEYLEKKLKFVEKQKIL